MLPSPLSCHETPGPAQRRAQAVHICSPLRKPKLASTERALRPCKPTCFKIASSPHSINKKHTELHWFAPAGDRFLRAEAFNNNNKKKNSALILPLFSRTTDYSSFSEVPLSMQLRPAYIYYSHYARVFWLIYYFNQLKGLNVN